jgi:hypothetical protein
MLLTYLDRMRPGHAFLGTTNLQVAGLTVRLQTRFPSTGKRGSRGIPSPAVGCTHLHHPPDRGRGQGQRQGGYGGFGDVDRIEK